MKLEGNTVLITGGGSGIGLELAKQFLAAGSDVTVCGRRADVLDQVRRENPGLKTRVADVQSPAQRKELAAWAIQNLPKLNVFINNAGVMRFPDLTKEPKLEDLASEIEIDLVAPIELSTLLAPHLAKNQGTIVNVTSGLAYVPLAAAPVYSAAKAGLASFTDSLRHQFRNSGLRVVELAPPHVNTDLGAPGSNTAGMPLDAFIAVAVDGLKKDLPRITTGFSTKSSEGSPAQRQELFRALNSGH
jgi:uncharacterized oxidoreductase